MQVREALKWCLLAADNIHPDISADSGASILADKMVLDLVQSISAVLLVPEEAAAAVLAGCKE